MHRSEGRCTNIMRVHGCAQGRAPPAAWTEVPLDIMREVAGKLGTHDVAAALLVCREWRDGFANGMTSLRPRVLRIAPLAARCGACLGTLRQL